ncbi:uncharacterized protein LOC105191610 [Harpegnathos saltator]|uniref:uncharacterized protein LOC105191610 n=1 Tax=Harpegnathos saltator TaxID=610380 RepID=UPI000DBEEB7C|nr:uncharacterized protein LOC105191610 [Harpegnathos saltator]
MNKIEYLVKYSVAPSPSRDYYGLRILQDEVILYLWKISHGPHKAPIIHRAKFTEFGREKLLQDEIRHGFGEHVLNHVRNIAEGSEITFLTLPESLVGKISSYLEYRDIIKLSSLSRIAHEVKETVTSLHTVIFNRDSIWKLLYKRDKGTKIDTGEREEAGIHGWKRLYQDRQMQTSTRDQKNLRAQSSIKRASDAKTNKPSLRTSNAPKPTSKMVSAVNIATKERSEFSNADLTTSLSRTSSDTRFRDPKTKKEKSFSLKKNPRSSNSLSNVNENVKKKEDHILSRLTTKQETKRPSKHDEEFDRRSKEPEKYIDKINRVKTTSQKNKTKYVASRPSPVSKSAMKSIKSSSDLAEGFNGKSRSKTKAKPKKVAVTSSEIFNNNDAHSDSPFVVRDDDFDLADLIEASLKKIRSPRSIFDYDFSCTPQTDATDGASRIKHEILNIDRSRQQQKSIRSNVMSNYFPGKMFQRSGTLEKLSEKSEPYSETSTESIVKDTKVSPEEKDELLSRKHTKTQVEPRKCLNVRKSDPMFFKDREDLRGKFRSKYFSPRKINNIDEKLSVTREPLRTSNLLKVHTPSSLECKKGFLAKSAEIEWDL